MNSFPPSKRVAVVGGGLAGLSAACALADAGFHVTLLERRPYLGGRASSYEYPGTGEIVDNCQHVLLGCCTNLIDFYRRLGVEEKIGWFDHLNFIEPGGRLSILRPASLPAPLHGSLSFLRAKFLDLGDKDAIARILMRLALGSPKETDENFLSWLERHGQTQRAIARFWKPVLVSALNEDLERMSLHYAAQVFRESFLKSAAGGRMGVPTVPLTDLYGAAGDYLRGRGGEVQMRCAVDSFSSQENGVSLRAREELSFDCAVFAVPFEALAKILPQDSSATPLRTMLACLNHSPITGIHLWFDQPITELPHAVLLDRTIQWMFHKSMLQHRWSGGGSYVELVVSSSKSLVEKSRQEIIDIAVKELREFFPAVAAARLTKATVIKEIHATYSARPRSDDYRPTNLTAWPNIFLAGDWTATGWPATMEGAVRSGYLAAEAVTNSLGCGQRFLAPDLPARGFMRLLE